MNIENETKFIMKKYNISANKKLGQNFLIDEETIEKTIDAAEITKEDLIIEIGPGLGTLTKPILERAGKVICIELDERMLTILNDRFGLYDNFKIINEDVLKVDLKSLIKAEKNEHIKYAKIVANLPYYITTPIIMKLLEDKLDIESITVMIQKEVADRLTAKPGEKNTGAITYSINYYTNPERICEVKNTCFIPTPEVDSTVSKLNIAKQKKIEVTDETLFFKIIKTAFMQKRKTLLNALSNGNIATKDEIKDILKKLDIDENIRGEKLTMEQYAQFTKIIQQNP